MPKFKMTVYKTETYTTVIEVDANSEADAELAAFDIADEMDPGNWHLEETDMEAYAIEVNRETA
jgi:hypothetical protein